MPGARGTRGGRGCPQKRSGGREIEKLWHQETLRQMAEFDKTEAAQVAKRKARDKEIAAVQTKQLEDYKEKFIQQLWLRSRSMIFVICSTF